jgi:hypothetical protein
MINWIIIHYSKVGENRFLHSDGTWTYFYKSARTFSDKEEAEHLAKNINAR